MKEIKLRHEIKISIGLTKDHEKLFEDSQEGDKDL